MDSDDSTTSSRRFVRDDLVAFLVIFVCGLVAAYVCFRLLDSSAEVSQGASVSGGLAGAVVSWSVLTSLYLTLSRNSRAVESLQDALKSLQAESVRQSPLPSEFEREIDQRHGLVFARPKTWVPRGGLLFEFVAPAEDGDLFSAQMTVTRVPWGSDGSGDQFFGRVREFAQSESVSFEGVLVEERIRLGRKDDEDVGVDALKFTLQCYALIQGGERPEYISRARAKQYVIGEFDAQFGQLSKVSMSEEHWAQLAQLRGDIVARVKRKIDDFSLDPRMGLAGSVKAASEMWSTGAGSSADSEGPETTGVAGTDVLVGARAAADAMDPGPPAELDVQIIPVTRVMVGVNHSRLRQGLLFEFADNVCDFAESSAYFNDILRTVRFLW